MAPVRRYLRITRYSVLEVRIYLENPSLAESWLLSSRSPALPRIIEAVRPLVLPKLREELENARKKGSGTKKRKAATKDTVVREDFEVAIFLTEAGSSHALMTKSKSFSEGLGVKRSDNLGIARYMGGREDPVDVDAVVREEEDEEGPGLDAFPAAPTNTDGSLKEVVDISSDEERPGRKGRKRRRVEEEDEGDDQKKKLGLRTGYEGFSIYGRILCLIVKRKGVKARGDRIAGGSEMLENWVSTQVDKEGVGVDD